jgi:CBS domain-containing protein
MYRVSEIMIREKVYCTPTTKVEESKSLMMKYRCSRIPVVDKNQMIIGAISLNDLQNDSRKVIECMSKNMKVVEEDSTVDECLRVMILNNIEQVPVIDKQGHFCGMVTEKEILKY